MDEKRLWQLELTVKHYAFNQTLARDILDVLAEIHRLRPVVEAAQAISDAFGPIETIPLPGLDTINYGPSANMVRAELIVRLREKLAALAGEKGETPCSS